MFISIEVVKAMYIVMLLLTMLFVIGMWTDKFHTLKERLREEHAATCTECDTTVRLHNWLATNPDIHPRDNPEGAQLVHEAIEAKEVFYKTHQQITEENALIEELRALLK